jgi:uncharacterized coiled-coil protein SlyX
VIRLRIEDLERQVAELEDANAAKDRRIADQDREIARLIARVNRLVPTAAIEDVNWRPER